MTFVTVGNATDGFLRLLEAAERLAGAGVLPAPVVFQSGRNRTFVSRHGETHPFMPMEDFEAHVRRARLVIGHAGAGTMLHALAAGKTPVVMPRRMRYAECVDDHQVELVEYLAGAGRVIPAWEAGDLAGAVDAALARALQPPAGRSEGLVQVVSECLEALLA